MKGSDRLQVFFVGFVIGSLLVGLILARRAAKNRDAEEQDRIVFAGDIGERVPLPDGVPGSLRRGRILMHGFLPDDQAPEDEVWVLGFDKNYPYVRVVRDLSSGEFDYMAADQVIVKVRAGIDITAVKPHLDALGLGVRTFNRRNNVLVVDVVKAGLDSVPATIEALSRAAEHCETIEPDRIRLRD